MPKKEEDFIPDNVKKQADAATAAQKAAAGDTPAEPDKPVEDPKKAEPVKKAEPKKKEPQKPQPKDDDSYRQKYEVLQGMYNKETNELKVALESVRQTVESQQTIIDSLNKVIESGKQSPAPADNPAPAPIETVKVDDFSGYGSEMEDLVKLINELVSRVAKLETRTTKSNVAPDIADRIDRIEQTQVMTAKDKFYAAMQDALPDWGEQNKDPKFLEWLEGIDPLSQIQRKVMLQHAFRSWNHRQVIALFKAFRDGTAPAPVSNDDDEPTGLDAEVLPETTGNADDGPGGKPPKKYATQDEYLKAQKDFIDKRITEAEFDKIAASYQRGLAAQKT